MSATTLHFPSNPHIASVQVNGEPHLSFMRVNLIFWGKAWTAHPPPALTAQTIGSAIASIVNSNFTAELAQYGVTGQPRLVAIDIFADTDPSPADFTSKLPDLINGRIAAGKVEAPSADLQSFYAVVVPTGVKSAEHPDFRGAHTTFPHGEFTSQMAWILNDGHLTTRTSPVHVFSHEFIEACATGSDVHVVTDDGKDGEIADFCTNDDDISNGYSLHAYYSAKDKVCVLPLTRPVTVIAGPVAAVSRGADSLDLAVDGMGAALDLFGGPFSAAWDRSKRNGLWRGWWSINSGRTVTAGATAAAISLVTRAPALLDAFTVGTDDKVYTAAWDSGRDVFDGAWRGWWRVVDVDAPFGAPIGAVAPGPDQLAIFVADTHGRLVWATWDRTVDDGAWRGWWPVLDLTTTPGGHVTAVSRVPGRIDVFAVADNGLILTASRVHEWQGWDEVAGGRAPVGAPVSAVSRDQNTIDAFVVGNDGGVYVATSDQTVQGGEWSGWKRIGALTIKTGSLLAAVARDADRMNIFAIGEEGGVWTAAWTRTGGTGAWGTWAHVADGTAAKGTSPSVVSRAADKLDVFIVGEDHGVWTAAWDASVANGAWQGWRPVPN